MSRYIKITNKGAVNRLFLEIIGLGAKRQRKDDSSVVIGQFQSGFKLATPAALRLGLEVIVSSADDKGKYILRFKTIKIKYTRSGETKEDALIQYCYSDGTTRELSISLHAFPEWENKLGDDDNCFYNILREYVANARDEDVNYTVEFGIKTIEQATDGVTVIYIEERSEIVEMLKKHSARYFKFLDWGTPLFEDAAIGAIYSKSSNGQMRFFNQGYLVGCVKGDHFGYSCYDYDIYGKDIVSETRIIKSPETYKERVAKLFTRIRDKKILAELLSFSCANAMSYEAEIFGRIASSDMDEAFKTLCREFWVAAYGIKTFLKCRLDKININVESLGYKTIDFGYYLLEFWKKIGIKDAEEGLREKLGQIESRPATPEEEEIIQKVLKDCFLRLKYYREHAPRYPISVFSDPSGLNAEGFAKDFKTLSLKAALLTEKNSWLIGKVYGHEFLHCVSGKGDMDAREFMDWADCEKQYLRASIALLMDRLESMGVDLSTISLDFVNSEKI